MSHVVVKIVSIYAWPTLALIFDTILTSATTAPRINFLFWIWWKIVRGSVDMDICVDVVNHCRLLLLVNRSSRLHRVFLKRPRSLLNHLPYSLTLLDQRSNIDQLVSILHTRQKSDIVCKIFVGIIVVLITDVKFLCFHLKVTHAWSWYSFSRFFILVEFL